MTSSDLLISQLLPMIARMDVPQHKLDPSKAGTCCWLLTNLRTRNRQHVAYAQVMTRLIELARANNWLKKSELKLHEQHLEQTPPAFNATPVQTGRQSSREPASSNVPKPGPAQESARRGGTITLKPRSGPQFHTLPSQQPTQALSRPGDRKL